MSEDTTHATITTTAPRLQRVLDSALPLPYENRYEHAYVRIEDGEVSIVGNIPGGSAFSYTTVTEDYFDEISGETEVLFDIKRFNFYLDNVGGDDGLEVAFRGDKGGSMASRVEMKGDLNARFYVTASESVKDEFNLGLLDRFEEGVLLPPEDTPNRDEKLLDSEIHTDTQTLQKVIDIVDADETSGIHHYPVVVKDGKFILQAGDKQGRDVIEGVLDAEDVSGDDVGNTYGAVFEELFSNISGDVQLNTTMLGGDPATLSVSQEPVSGVVYRHTLGPNGTV